MSYLKGQYGETLALQFLESKGHKVVHQNFRSIFGEIDLITQNNQEIYFTEVKSFSSKNYLHPIHQITQQKLRKITKTIKYYLSKNNLWNTQVHVSVILILDHKIHEYIEDAYELFE